MKQHKFEIITVILAIACLLYVNFVPIPSSRTSNKCPPYELPNFLEGRTDGMCTAIGMLLLKATKHTDCIMVTNDWWPADKKRVTRAMALEYAKDY